MRVYTKRQLFTGNTIHPDDFNAETSAIAEVLNRNVDSHNLPIGVITPAKLGDRAYTVPSYEKSAGVWSDFYTTDDFASDGVTPILSVDLRTDANSAIWSSLSEAGLEEAALSISPAQGLLRGTAVIGWERRFGYNSPGFTVREGGDHWVDFGVFADNQLIAQTGPLYPRRYTSTLHWFLFQNGGPLDLDIRYRVMTNVITSTNDHYAQDLDFFTIGHYLRNQKR